jgi:hypothetical protein
MADTPKWRGRTRRPATRSPDAEGFTTCTRYTHDVAREIVRRIANGENWIDLANTDGLPAHSTLYYWRDKHPDFAGALRRAREIAADLKADRALQVAEAAKAGSVTADRLHYQALMTRAAFDAPERWSDKPRAAPKPEAVEIVFRVRHFERVVGPDGKAFVRELKRKRGS